MTRKMSAENDERSYKASDLGGVVKKNRRKNKWGEEGRVWF